MNGAHLHLVLNHFPLVGLVFAAMIFLIGIYRSNESYIRIALFITVVSGLFAVPTFLTGEPAEEVIEKLPGFSENLLEHHEEAAEFAIWVIGAAAALAAVSLWQSLKKNSVPKFLLWATLAISLVALIAIGRTASLGGKISHPEIRDSSDEISAQSGDHD